MATFAEMIFLVQFLAVIGIFLLKLYNVMNFGKFYGGQILFLGLIGYIMAWGVGLFTMIINYTQSLYRVLFVFESVTMPLVIGLTLAEILFMIKDNAKNAVEAYNSRNVRAEGTD